MLVLEKLAAQAKLQKVKVKHAALRKKQALAQRRKPNNNLAFKMKLIPALFPMGAALFCCFFVIEHKDLCKS